jgi:tetratricopeptide (TPR) repeat protein
VTDEPVPIDQDSQLIARARRQAARARETSASGGGPSLTVPVDWLPNYRLLGEVHRGGQGVVYRALQESTGREVAVKVLKQGPFAGPEDRQRFEREVRVLAALRHPHIVSVHDGGSADGFFWFVMDWIPGRSLSEHVAHERPSVPDLLRLFVRIADAVHAAHLRGVAHRDLKPGNIRVDPEGAPHVLDFGLAKLPTTDEDDGMTRTGQFVGSLPWASPEQAEGRQDEVDLRTDVYSLGVLLYESLTGRFPYRVSGSLREVMDAIATADPPPPSRAARELDDEVDAIVLRCLAKEPARRYQTAGEVARDLERYLAGQPIDARRDSTGYLLRKTLRRYRVPLAVGGLFLVVVTAATIVLSILLHRQRFLRNEAERHARAARERFHLAREAATALVEEASGRLQNVAGTTGVRRELLEAALAQLARLTTGERSDPDVELDLIECHLSLANIASELGEAKRAAEESDSALERTRARAAAGRESQRVLARALLVRAGVRMRSGDLDEAKRDIAEARELAGRLLSDASEDETVLRLLSLVVEREAIWAERAGQKDQERESTTNMLELKQRLLAHAPGNPQRLHELSIALERAGDLAQRDGDLDTAEKHAREALRIREQLSAREPRNPLYQRAVLLCCEDLARVAHSRKQLEEDARWTGRMHELAQSLVELEPQHPTHRHDLAQALSRLGHLAYERGELEQAATHHQKALDLLERLADREPTTPRWREDALVERKWLATIADRCGRTDESRERYGEVIRRGEALLREPPERPQVVEAVAQALQQNARGAQGEAAAKPLRRARELYELLLEREPTSMTRKLQVSHVCYLLGQALRPGGDPEAVRDAFQRSLELEEDVLPRTPDACASLTRMALALDTLAQLDWTATRASDAGRDHLVRYGEIAGRLARECGRPDGAHWNLYARHLLSCRIADLRDPSAALTAAERAVELSKERNLDYLDTLAMACSRNGHADRAVEAAEKMKPLVRPGDAETLRKVEDRIRRYRALAERQR